MKAELCDLMLALEVSIEEQTYYLDRNTGETLLVSSEDERHFEEGFEGEFAPDWQMQNFKN